MCAKTPLNGQAHFTYFFNISFQGYEVIGLDKIPDKGAALLVYYHGALPIDMYYIIAKMLLYKKRSLKNVVATFLFRLPGINMLHRFVFSRMRTARIHRTVKE